MTMNPTQFVDMLGKLPDLKNVYNPWSVMTNERGPYERSTRQANSKIRRGNLLAYLELRRKAKIVVLGEAPGFRGARFSGIAFTSERIMLGQHNLISVDHVIRTDEVDLSLRQTSLDAHGMTEPSATIVWTRLLDHGLKGSDFVLWNAFPCHPEGATWNTNRAPTELELAAHGHALNALLTLYPAGDCLYMAVGKIAERELEKRGVHHVPIRHPANGGAAAFEEQTKNALAARRSLI